MNMFAFAIFVELRYVGRELLQLPLLVRVDEILRVEYLTDKSSKLIVRRDLNRDTSSFDVMGTVEENAERIYDVTEGIAEGVDE